jgi:Type II secretion system (T2SS), protein E, N-terminal domain
MPRMGVCPVLLQLVASARKKLWRKNPCTCGARDCAHPRNLWSRLRRRRSSVLLHGIQYCVPECLEQALHAAVPTTQPTIRQKAGAHRVPLGLLLLSRNQVTESQLRMALAEQQAVGRGRIGDWLQGMGFASEPQIAAALARQWSCPVLLTEGTPLSPVLWPQIPSLLLHLFQMIPISFVGATATLHVGFADRVDYAVLYAIGQMLDCRTEHCVVLPSLLRESLRALGESRPVTDVVFEGASSTSELVTIVSNYAIRVSAQEIRIAGCGPYSWVRFRCKSGQSLNMLLRMPPHSRTASQHQIDSDPAA